MMMYAGLMLYKITIIFYHKHISSALVRVVKMETGVVCTLPSELS